MEIISKNSKYEFKISSESEANKYESEVDEYGDNFDSFGKYFVATYFEMIAFKSMLNNCTKTRKPYQSYNATVSYDHIASQDGNIYILLYPSEISNKKNYKYSKYDKDTIFTCISNLIIKKYKTIQIYQ
jgi:hypothetical protein